jgi:hypothetical protein
MSPGDIVIPYLCNWRFALPAKIVSLALADAEVDPTGRGMSHPELPGFGRRIHVRWLKNGAPPLDKVAVVPDAFRSGPHRCMVAQTVEPLNPERYARFMRIIRNRRNWRTYEATYAGHRTRRNGADGAIYPDELPSDHNYYEGAVAVIQVNKYERDPLARKACLAEHGTDCMVCGLSFNAGYGAIGEGFIHVHHLKPLAAMERKYRINPITDLAPVCPNCHAMLHRQNPPFSIQQLKARLRAGVWPASS